jgi:hypothetical protein
MSDPPYALMRIFFRGRKADPSGLASPVLIARPSLALSFSRGSRIPCPSNLRKLLQLIMQMADTYELPLCALMRITGVDAHRSDRSADGGQIA